MEKKKIPKVLIIGESFHLNSGGGITLTNLFKDWPLDKIAVATFSIDKVGVRYCTNYYKLGYEETIRPWPFNILQKKSISGPVLIDDQNINSFSNTNAFKKSSAQSRLKSVVLRLRHYSGLYPIIYRMNVSQKFIDWVFRFQPDIIYTQLSSLSYIRFVSQLIKITQIPLAIHIMDDWPKTLKEPGLLYFYWKHVINQSFRKLLNYASVHMSICHAMSKAYRDRYGIEFIPFQNTLDLNNWEHIAKTDWHSNGNFTILYAGRIGQGTFDSVLFIAQAVEMLGNEGIKLLFKIRSGSISEEYDTKLKNFKFTIQDKFLPHDQMPKELSSVDLLVIPLDFDELEFTRLSMPTKVPEYLASGTPILVVASKETALYQYASEQGWGYTVTENKAEKLVEAIRHLHYDVSLREKIGSKGKSVARKYHDSEKIRENFRRILANAAKNGNNY